MSAHGKNQAKEDAKMADQFGKLIVRITAFENRNWEQFTPTEFDAITRMRSGLTKLAQSRRNYAKL